jgi:PIN domain nuclease of toxin-antitoxin system
VGSALTVLDAQAIVAALLGEPATAEVEAILRDVSDPPRISAVNVAEVIDVLVRRHGAAPDDVLQRLEWLQVGGLATVAADEAIGLLAGRLRARHYRSSDRAVSLADCVALATALHLGDRLATADPALADLAAEEGCRIVALPDSRGRRPGSR